MKMQHKCNIGECTKSYENAEGLKTHRRRKHNGWSDAYFADKELKAASSGIICQYCQKPQTSKQSYYSHKKACQQKEQLSKQRIDRSEAQQQQTKQDSKKEEEKKKKSTGTKRNTKQNENKGGGAEKVVVRMTRSMKEQLRKEEQIDAKDGQISGDESELLQDQELFSDKIKGMPKLGQEVPVPIKKSKTPKMITKPKPKLKKIIVCSGDTLVTPGKVVEEDPIGEQIKMEDAAVATESVQTEKVLEQMALDDNAIMIPEPEVPPTDIPMQVIIEEPMIVEEVKKEQKEKQERLTIKIPSIKVAELEDAIVLPSQSDDLVSKEEKKLVLNQADVTDSIAVDEEVVIMNDSVSDQTLVAELIQVEEVKEEQSELYGSDDDDNYNDYYLSLYESTMKPSIVEEVDGKRPTIDIPSIKMAEVDEIAPKKGKPVPKKGKRVPKRNKAPQFNYSHSSRSVSEYSSSQLSYGSEQSSSSIDQRHILENRYSKEDRKIPVEQLLLDEMRQKKRVLSRQKHQNPRYKDYKVFKRRKGITQPIMKSNTSHESLATFFTGLQESKLRPGLLKQQPSTISRSVNSIHKPLQRKQKLYHQVQRKIVPAKSRRVQKKIVPTKRTPIIDCIDFGFDLEFELASSLEVYKVQAKHQGQIQTLQKNEVSELLQPIISPDDLQQLQQVKSDDLQYQLEDDVVVESPEQVLQPPKTPEKVEELFSQEDASEAIIQLRTPPVNLSRSRISSQQSKQTSTTKKKVKRDSKKEKALKLAVKNNTKISQFFSKPYMQRQQPEVATPQASQMVDIEEEKINEIMLADDESSKRNSLDLRIRGYHCQLTEENFNCLQGSGYLTNTLVGDNLNMLKLWIKQRPPSDDNKKILILSHSFYGHLQDRMYETFTKKEIDFRGAADALKISARKQWSNPTITKPETALDYLLSYDIIIVPILDVVRKHWILMTIDVLPTKELNIIVANPWRNVAVDVKDPEMKEYTKAADESFYTKPFCQLLDHLKKEQQYLKSLIRWAGDSQVVQQDNDHDCGVFLVFYINQIVIHGNLSVLDVSVMTSILDIPSQTRRLMIQEGLKQGKLIDIEKTPLEKQRYDT